MSPATKPAEVSDAMIGQEILGSLTSTIESSDVPIVIGFAVVT
ncbi:hypothetical protein LCGC14_1816260 [marine sediment metagenome]|uniref:Uncharacterized protein n=1 Tax=marine sediment metagenome TaxID=412755 RepID=A0A0F9J046_9ZZZZ